MLLIFLAHCSRFYVWLEILFENLEISKFFFLFWNLKFLTCGIVDEKATKWRKEAVATVAVFQSPRNFSLSLAFQKFEMFWSTL